MGENTDVPVRSLFGESKMKDFTPLDLLIFNSQIKNFTLLCIIWIITDIIRTGLDFRKKYIYEYIDRIEFPIIYCCLEIFLSFLLLFINYKYTYSLQRILVVSNYLNLLSLYLLGFLYKKPILKLKLCF